MIKPEVCEWVGVVMDAWHLCGAHTAELQVIGNRTAAQQNLQLKATVWDSADEGFSIRWYEESEQLGNSIEMEKV